MSGRCCYNVQLFVKCWPAQIGIHDQDALAGLSKHRGQIQHRDGFALPAPALTTTMVLSFSSLRENRMLVRNTR